jgi:hypothetical protein
VFHNVKRFGMSAAVRLSAEFGFLGEFTMFSERIFWCPATPDGGFCDADTGASHAHGVWQVPSVV